MKEVFKSKIEAVCKRWNIKGSHISTIQIARRKEREEVGSAK